MVSFYSKSFCIIGTSLFLLDKRNPSAAYYAEGQEKRRNGPRRHDVRSAGASSQAPAPTTVPKMHAARRRDRLRSAGRPNGTPQPPKHDRQSSGTAGRKAPCSLQEAPRSRTNRTAGHTVRHRKRRRVSVCGAAAKTAAERKNGRDSCRAERGESKPAGNQRPEAAAAGACPDAGAAGAAGVSTSSAGPSAAESFVAESSAAAGASNRGTPSI